MKEYYDVLKHKNNSDWSLLEYEYIFKDFYNDYKEGKYRSSETIKEVIGGYGEMLFFNKLSEDDRYEVTWVSREHGDMFGFDIMAYNYVTEKFYFYEVKTTISRNNLKKFYLSPNEYKRFYEIGQQVYQGKPVEMHIINLLVDDNGIVDMVDYEVCDDWLAFLELDYQLTVTHGSEKEYHGDILKKKINKKIDENKA